MDKGTLTYFAGISLAGLVAFWWIYQHHKRRMSDVKLEEDLEEQLKQNYQKLLNKAYKGLWQRFVLAMIFLFLVVLLKKFLGK